MTLVFVAKDMSVVNPVGVVNLHPLPSGLPSGLVRAHLMRLGLKTVRMNLVDGQETGLVESASGSASILTDIEYRETSVHSSHGQAGWRDPDYAVDYDTGYTWLVVARDSQIDVVDDPRERDNYLAATGHYSPKAGEELSWRKRGIRFQVKRKTEIALSIIPEEPVEGFYMGFASLDRVNKKATLFLPHTNEESVGDEGADDEPPPAISQLLLSRSSEAFAVTNGVRDCEMQFFAAWSRPLDPAEMMTAYQKLKPWLAARGASIA